MRLRLASERAHSIAREEGNRSFRGRLRSQPASGGSKTAWQTEDSLVIPSATKSTCSMVGQRSTVKAAATGVALDADHPDASDAARACDGGQAAEAVSVQNCTKVSAVDGCASR